MRYSIKRGVDDTIQLVLESQNDEEDEVLRDLYVNGRILALGETSRGRAELVLATSPERRLEIHPHAVGGGRHGESFLCRCPVCEYELELEEGQRCEDFECPRDHRRLIPA